MSRNAVGSRRSSIRMLLAAAALVLVSAAMWVGPAAAHTFTRSDGNDSLGRLDLRSVSVSHTATAVVHKVRTFESWTSKALGHDSFFLIQIDRNNGPQGDYERCAFIFYTTRLRGSLTNCGNQFIRYLPVAKPSGTVATITIPKSQTGNVYEWAVASRWEGPPPCGACIDFAPNSFPDILHDMVPPVVNLEPSPLRVWENSTSAMFTFPFSVSDAHSGIKSWTVQRRQVGLPSWTFVTSGTTGGPKSPDVVGAEGTRYDYRVVAVDEQGNQRIRIRRVYIPIDDDDPDVQAGFSVPSTPVDDATAFGGTYSEMSSGTFTYTWTPGTDCLFELIGPSSGDWDVTVTPAGGSPTNITDDNFVEDLPRQTLYSNTDCSATSYVVTLNSGTFGLDAVLG